MKAEPVEIRLTFTAPAYGLLVAMAAADGHASVEKMLVDDAASSVSAFLEFIGDTPYAIELFKTGRVRSKRKEVA